jgi:cell division protein FtsN
MPFIQETAQSLADQPAGMTAAGWFFIAIAWTTIISIAVFCYRKVLQKAEKRKQQALLESPPLAQEVRHEKVSK